MISADLLLKGLGGAAVVGGATGVGVCYHQKLWIFAEEKREELVTFAARVGLVCTGNPTATTGIECSKSTKADSKLRVKKDTDTTPFELANLPDSNSGKIKVYEDNTYNNKFKFVIEEGDIGTDPNKLGEFETYEIKKHGNDDWRLTIKDKASVLKGKLLGLSGVGTCKLPEETDETTCSNLTAEDLKKIKFDGKTEGGTVTIDNGSQQEAANITLKISKSTEEPFNTGDYKFVLETNKNISIPKSEGAITIKKGTNTEFKIKATPASGAPKVLTLEKAWSLNDLIAKVGITNCAASSGTPKECSFTSAKVNLFIDASNHTKGSSVKSSDGSKKIKVEEDQEGHNQGFKFYTEENEGISLENGTATGTVEKKIEKKESSANTPTYEIKQQTVGDTATKDWYLTKKTAAN